MEKIVHTFQHFLIFLPGPFLHTDTKTIILNIHIFMNHFLKHTSYVKLCKIDHIFYIICDENVHFIQKSLTLFELY